MASDEQRLWTEDGLLTWDGRVLELFPTNGKDRSWRLHAATVLRWESQQHRGVAQVRIFDHAKHYEVVVVTDAQLPWIEAVMAQVEAVRRGR